MWRWGMSSAILVVEDHDEVRSSLVRWLGDLFPGSEVVEAKDGEDGVAVACSRRPEVVLMDISMPKINGIEAARRIKAAVPDTSVVILTVHDAADYRADAVASGAAGYVLKSRAHVDLVPLLKGLMSP